MSPQRKSPLYITPNCGIEVISEFPTSNGLYMRCYIRPHPFFSGTTVLRSRVVMTDLLGRKLLRNEHVHHGKKGRLVDTHDNLTLLTAAKHNSHHKAGSKHSTDAKQKIADGLRRAHSEGRRPPVDVEKAKQNLAEWNRKVRSGEIVVPWSKPERNAELVAHHKACGSVQETAEHFGITPNAAYYVIRRHAPSQLRKWRRRS